MNIAEMIDHTLLKADVVKSQIAQLCSEAKQYSFASVCIHPFYVRSAHDLLVESKTMVCTVIGFPLGMQTTESKVFETQDAIRNRADEIDMVINIGALKAQREEIVQHEIESVIEAAQGKVVKVILETCLLNEQQIKNGCQLAKEAGADYVKTSTGFSSGGALIEDVKIMRQSVGQKMGVKASGGIRDYQTAMAMIEAGANRIGTSNGVSIVQGNRANNI